VFEANEAASRQLILGQGSKSYERTMRPAACGRCATIDGGTPTMETSLSKFQPQVLSILRTIAGLLFLSSGLQKWFGFPVANPNFANITLISMVGIAGLIETMGGVLVTVGLYTRAAAFIMSGEMAVAYWYYANRPAKGFMPIQNGGTLEVLFCFVFFYLVFAGAGVWSVDATLRKKA
jgi:putative oxidoreductase